MNAYLDSPNWDRELGVCRKHMLPSVPCPACIASKDEDMYEAVDRTLYDPQLVMPEPEEVCRCRHCENARQALAKNECVNPGGRWADRLAELREETEAKMAAFQEELRSKK